MRRLAASAVSLAFGLGGCMVGPDYTRPTVPVPQTYRTPTPKAQDLANTAWWQQFEDPVLDGLINEALANNKDLRIAAGRVEEFAGVLQSTRAQLFPQIGYGAAGSRDRFSKRLDTAAPAINPQTTYQAVLNASWEIDLWGKIRRQTEAAQASLFSTEEARRGVVLSLVSATAIGYITLRDLDNQLEITKATAKAYGESLKLFELRFKGGVVSEVELAQIRSEYEFALAQIPDYERLIASQENALSVLLGRNPGPVLRGKSIAQLTPPAVPSGLPSELLERRPDIRQAEQDLIAANARIGAARAQYFPTVSLTGALGTASSELNNLFEGASRTWSYGGSVIGPIFTFGLIEGLVAQSEAQQRELLANYERTIQNAFREVDDSLVDSGKFRERLVIEKRRLGALNDYVRLAKIRFDNGYTGYLEVLDAERSLFAAQLDYAANQGQLLTALVNIYKAMGGGWVTEADKRVPLELRPFENTPGEPAANLAPETASK
jgi:multidrug efflux system outer membrane protein